MILLAFFFPVAVYLLVLGGINRRRCPLMVSGVWDFIGILLAASGFLFLGGPAILSGLNQNWRLFWLLGRTDQGPPNPEGVWQFWLFLSVLYFVLVVAGAGFLLWRQRALTAVYNVDRGVVEKCLDQVCEELHLLPVRSGNLYLFGLAAEGPGTAVPPHGAIQRPHYLPEEDTTIHKPGERRAAPRPEGERDFLGQTAVLEVETFLALRHVSLRWEPTDSLFRHEIEGRLERVLAETPTEGDSDVGSWLTVIGLALLGLVLLGGMLVVVLRIVLR